MFTPVEDTYVDSSHPTTSFGSKPSVFLDGIPQKQAFLKFALSTLSGRTVTDVRLRMQDVDSSSFGGTVWSMTTTDWSESITWATRPSIDGTALGSYGPVAKGGSYVADLGVMGLTDGLLSLGIDTTNADAAAWSSRESLKPPELIVEVEAVSGLTLDGLSEVANPWLGSSDPTYYASQHRVVLTDGGRLLVLHGRHQTGVQMAWRDPGGGWQRTTTGEVSDGLLVPDTAGTGDWAASIALAEDSTEVQHAWVVWSGPYFSKGRAVEMRRLSDLDSPNGPTVGPVVTVEPLGLGNVRADLAFEETADGLRRGAVVFYAKTSSSSYDMVVSWFTDLDSDAPAVHDRAVLFSNASALLSATLASTPGGLQAVARSKKLYTYRHDASNQLTSWARSTAGLSAPASVHPSATVLETGDVLAAVADTDSSSVIRFSPTGTTGTVEEDLVGYRDPSLTGNGTNAWLVMIRASDGLVVSRTYSPDMGWSTDDVVEIGEEGGGNYEWPNVAPAVDGRLRFIVRGPFFPGKTNQSEVLAFQRSI